MQATLVSPPNITAAPPIEHGSRRPGLAWAAQRPLALTLLLAFVGALLLQLWRPYFFLTCDTISGVLPVTTEAYRRLWEGRSPFYNEYLFGGFDMRADPGNFTLWNPLVLPFTFLARTRFYYVLPDIVGTLSLVAIAGAFCWSALRLRRVLDLPIPNALIVALSLSYAFTPYNFIVGASWLGFLNAQAAYPVILAGAFERDWRRALAIQAAGLLYAIFGGHMHLTMMLMIFAALTVVLAAIVQRRVRPILVWAGAGLVTLILILPLLWPAIVGFSQTSRSAGVSTAVQSADNIALPALSVAFLLGPLCQGLVGGIPIDLSDPTYNLAIAFALVNLPLVGFLVWKRGWNALEIGLAALALLTMVFIARPHWLAEIFSSLPLLKSLRWPFREIAVLHFFTHALFLVAFRPLTRRPARTTVLAGCAGGMLAFALVFLCTAPTFWLFEPDRRLIISGEADRYWDALKENHGLDSGPRRFVVEAEPPVLMRYRSSVPFSLLGGFNFASLFRVHNVDGFSVTPPPNAQWLKKELGVESWFWGGVFSTRAVDRIVAAHPDIQRIVLTGMPMATWKIFNGAETEIYRYDFRSGQILKFTPSPSPGSPAPAAASPTVPAIEP